MLTNQSNFDRYSGSACDECSPGFTKASGLCQSLYINGESVNSRLPAIARASHLDELNGNDGNPSSSMIVWIAVGCTGAFIICCGCILILLVCKRRRTLPHATHGSRRRSQRYQQVKLLYSFHTMTSQGGDNFVHDPNCIL